MSELREQLFGDQEKNWIDMSHEQIQDNPNFSEHLQGISAGSISREKYSSLKDELITAGEYVLSDKARPSCIVGLWRLLLSQIDNLPISKLLFCSQIRNSRLCFWNKSNFLLRRECVHFFLLSKREILA